VHFNNNFHFSEKNLSSTGTRSSSEQGEKDTIPMISSPLPALLGGTPVRPQGPPEWPVLDDAVRTALEAAYRDGSWGKYLGPHVERLEARLAEYHEVPHVLVCGSGTFAVELALRALRIEAGDEVVLAAYDYGGNFLAVHAIGARPVLIDVAADDWNLAPERLAAAVGPKTKALIVSHLHGGLVPMRDLMQRAAALGLRVVEDAAQAPGARVGGRRAGTWGDVGVLSFGGSKLLTAGRGGALLTRHADVQQRARVAQQRGNVVCPLSELQAAVLLPQLEKLDERNSRRAENVRRLTEGLRTVPGLRPFARREVGDEPGYYKLGFRYDAAAFGLRRERFTAALRAEGMAFDEGFRALHVGRSPGRYRRGGELTEAEAAHRGCVVLHHPVLLGGAVECDEVVRAVEKACAAAAALA
jgi:dTDP-4-amino-4,6-dideoxygalactose transaminase